VLTLEVYPQVAEYWMKASARKPSESEEILTVFSRSVYMPFLHCPQQTTVQVSTFLGSGRVAFDDFASRETVEPHPWLDRVYACVSASGGSSLCR